MRVEKGHGKPKSGGMTVRPAVRGGSWPAAFFTEGFTNRCTAGISLGPAWEVQRCREPSTDCLPCR